MRTFATKQNQAQKQVTSSFVRSNQPGNTLAHHTNRMLHWHRTSDNQPAQRAAGANAHSMDSAGATLTGFVHDFSRIPLFPPTSQSVHPPIQRKPVVSLPGSSCEREADDVADEAARTDLPATRGSATAAVQRQCADCNGEQGQPMQTMPGAPTQADAPSAGFALRATERGGMPLPGDVSSYFGRRLGYDFSRVRVHADGEGAAAAHGIGARAYTVGPHIAFASGEYAPQSTNGKRLLAHELVHVVQQGGVAATGPRQPSVSSASHMNATWHPVIQRKPQNPEKDPKAEEPEAPKGPHQRLYVVRDKNLQLGGELVDDLSALRSKLLSTKTETEWTLVLSMHGSQDRLGAQSPPDWQKNAKFYEAPDIEKLFGNDKDFVKWRDKYGPTSLSLVSCQVSKSFEATLIKNLTRIGKSGAQTAKGLGAGCKPIATKVTLDDAPAKRSAFDKLSQSKRDSISKQLKDLNDKWGYYGAPPVPENQILDYYYSEEPKGAWVKVEVMVGTSHEIKDLKKTDIPFWNRTTGSDAAKFRQWCDQGVGELKRERKPSAPPDPDQ